MGVESRVGIPNITGYHKSGGQWRTASAANWVRLAATKGTKSAFADWERTLRWKTPGYDNKARVGRAGYRKSHRKGAKNTKKTQMKAERLDMRLEGQLRDHKFFRGRWWDTVMEIILPWFR